MHSSILDIYPGGETQLHIYMHVILCNSLLFRVIENVRLLGEKVQIAETLHKAALRHVKDSNDTFRALDRDLNTLRPELMRLQWEKDQYTRYVMKSDHL